MDIKMTKTLTQQEWYAIINGLRYMGETYVNEHSGVSLTKLADELAADMLAEHEKDKYADATIADPSTPDFERFAPTVAQVAFVTWWMRGHSLKEVFVAVNFPDKEYGYWKYGQKREPVLENGAPVFWTDRNAALIALRTGKYGNAVFRVSVDGRVGTAIEYI